MFRKDTPNVHDHVHADGRCIDMFGTCVTRPCMYGTFQMLKNLSNKAVNLTLESSSYEFSTC